MFGPLPSVLLPVCSLEMQRCDGDSPVTANPYYFLPLPVAARKQGKRGRFCGTLASRVIYPRVMSDVVSFARNEIRRTYVAQQVLVVFIRSAQVSIAVDAALINFFRRTAAPTSMLTTEP